MPLFQLPVEKQYLERLDDKIVLEAYSKFKLYFHNPERQENIRDAKEEQFQEGFLDALFVKILGYTLNPEPHYNLTTEFKNEKDSKKADGAILSEGKAIGVIELKGTDTADLDKISTQAFNYKNNQSSCVYVVTSNFEKLWFYIHDAVEHIEFNLFALTESQFKLLWLCLSKESIFAGIPQKIKSESLKAEEIITKKLYADYSFFKNELWQDLVKNNAKHDKLLLYKKSQKLLDRFLFILFSEDKGLLPPNSIVEIVKQWEKLKDMDEYRPLYDRFKKYFNYMNEGHKGKEHEIFAYNGGLFLPDELLDAIVISDVVLNKHIVKLAGYDFASEVDVNILGHIFEHSLAEIEAVTAELEGKEIDKSKTKRKKDGIFYTPKYITKYIVENTVGKLCAEKKTELEIIEDEFTKERKNRKKETLKKLDSKLKQYREWLLQITICDPACGSGAFLNQALDFLIVEHRRIDELHALLFGGTIIFQDVENQILENNIYGLDINEESIEIARLSLWLRTAHKGRKLTSLSNNIKCGNSLIDDSSIAGDKAFNWKKGFPEVFAKKGFDVVIGNPPYLRVQGLRDNFEKETKYYEKSYQSATGRFDIYVLFIEKAFQLINDRGLVSFILPHKFMISDFGEGIRDFLLKNEAINSIVHFGAEMVFDDASTYTCVIGLSKANKNIKYKQIKPLNILYDFQFDILKYNSLSKEKWNLQGGDGGDLFKKLSKLPLTVKDVFENVSQGIVSVGDDIFLIKGKIKGGKFIGYSEKAKREIEIEADIVVPVLKGDDVKKYAPLTTSYFIIYPHYEKNGKTVPYEEVELKNKFPLAYNYFLPYKEELIEKKIRYKTNPTCWYSLHRSREISLFKQEKIVTPETSLGGNMTIDKKGLFHNTQVYSLVKKKNSEFDNKTLIAILNSSLFWYYLQNTGAVLRGGYFRFKTKYLEPFPLPKADKTKQEQFSEAVNKIMKNATTLSLIQTEFINLLQSKFSLGKLSNKLLDWFELDFKEFLSELKKVKVKFSLSDEAEWMKYFNEEKQKAQSIKSEIDKTNNAIDKMVYTLYGLTGEEIKIVEG